MCRCPLIGSRLLTPIARIIHPPPCQQMGFEQSKVVSTLSRLNYRGNNVKNISDNAVLEELLK
jgi:hypothetical protein